MRDILQVAPLWFFAQLTFNASLHLTSVTSNTILSSSSALCTFLFSVLLLSEQFTYFKFGCIITLMLGTAAVTISDANGDGGEQGSIAGDLLCLLSAVLYGLYTVAIRHQIRGDDRSVSMSLFFGIMGSAILSIIGPILALFSLAGISFGSLTWKTFGIVIIKGILDNVLSDYIWARSILLLGGL